MRVNKIRLRYHRQPNGLVSEQLMGDSEESIITSPAQLPTADVKRNSHYTAFLKFRAIWICIHDQEPKP
jgi:hypothetical protein